MCVTITHPTMLNLQTLNFMALSNNKNKVGETMSYGITGPCEHVKEEQDKASLGDQEKLLRGC